MFDQAPENVRVLSGESATFLCNATSEPVHSIRWEREGVIIAEYLSPQDSQESIENFSRLNVTRIGEPTVISDTKYELMGEGPLYGSLTVLDTVLDDAREYTCFVGNVHGTISASATLLVQGNFFVLVTVVMYHAHCKKIKIIYSKNLNCNC